MSESEQAPKPKHYAAKLQEELAEAKATITELRASLLAHSSVGVSEGGTLAVEMATAPANGFTSEPEFIDMALARITANIDFSRGMMTDAVKKLFNQLDAAVKVRRMAIEVVESVGVGKDWPQFSALGRDPNTGRRLPPKPVAPVAPAEPLPTVSEGGMPVRNGPSRDEILKAVTGGDPRAGLMAEIAQRATPTRQPEPQAV